MYQLWMKTKVSAGTWSTDPQGQLLLYKKTCFKQVWNTNKYVYLSNNCRYVFEGRAGQGKSQENSLVCYRSVKPGKANSRKVPRPPGLPLLEEHRWLQLPALPPQSCSLVSWPKCWRHHRIRPVKICAWRMEARWAVMPASCLSPIAHCATPVTPACFLFLDCLGPSPSSLSSKSRWFTLTLRIHLR